MMKVMEIMHIQLNNDFNLAETNIKKFIFKIIVDII